MPKKKDNKTKQLRAPGKAKYSEAINNYTALREAIKHQHIPRDSIDETPKKTGFVFA